MRDMYGRDLNIGDRCIRISRSLKSLTIQPIIVESFTKKMVNTHLGTRVMSHNLLILTPEGINEFNRRTEENTESLW